MGLRLPESNAGGSAPVREGGEATDYQMIDGKKKGFAADHALTLGWQQMKGPKKRGAAVCEEKGEEGVAPGSTFILSKLSAETKMMSNVGVLKLAI